jgi:hypothetical protein
MRPRASAILECIADPDSRFEERMDLERAMIYQQTQGDVVTKQ